MDKGEEGCPGPTRGDCQSQDIATHDTAHAWKAVQQCTHFAKDVWHSSSTVTQLEVTEQTAVHALTWVHVYNMALITNTYINIAMTLSRSSNKKKQIQ